MTFLEMPEDNKKDQDIYSFEKRIFPRGITVQVLTRIRNKKTTTRKILTRFSAHLKEAIKQSIAKS